MKTTILFKETKRKTCHQGITKVWRIPLPKKEVWREITTLEHIKISREGILHHDTNKLDDMSLEEGSS